MEISSDLTTLMIKMTNALRLSGYSEITIIKFKTVFKQIGKAFQDEGCRTYEDVFWNQYGNKTAAMIREGRWKLGAIEYFDATGDLPGGTRRSRIGVTTRYDRLSDDFKTLVDQYRKSEANRGITASTIRTTASNGICFLVALQEKGIRRPEQITAGPVVDYFCPNDGMPMKSGSLRKNLLLFFRACSSILPEGMAERIIGFIPEISCIRKNIQYLHEEEIANVSRVLLDGRSDLTERDRAIGLLAMYAGLRSCDIAGLLLTDIDWNNDTLLVSQQKTGRPLNLPLPAVLGNAIYDYIQQERPEAPVAEVFLTKTPPYRRMASGDCYNIASLIMDRAGIRMKRGDRRGLHVFRHHLATGMLAKGVPAGVISKVLGHSSPESTRAYLRADFAHLKECSLSIEEFPVRKGVLE